MAATITAALRDGLRRLRRVCLYPLLWAMAVSSCGQARVDQDPRGLLAELARDADPAQAFEARLSIWSADPPCVPRDAAEAAGRVACGSGSSDARSGRIADIAARASQSLRRGSDPTALHVLALIDLLNGPGEKSLQSAISSLQTAARESPRPAPVLADLSAAYLVRGERAHTLRDLAAAVEAAEAALEREPANQTARYNLALALERLNLTGEAEQEWRTYLAHDQGSGWAREARRHREQLLALPVEPAPPSPGAPPAAYAGYATAEPQRARELGWCRVLGDWAGAVLAGNARSAEEQLRRAETLGATLERRAGGDATLADGVRAIRATRGAGLRRLAQAHQSYSAGCEEERRVRFAAAKEAFASAVASSHGSPVLEAWARVHQAAATFHDRDLRAGQAALRELAERADSLRHPALAGSARQAFSAALLRDDLYDEGLDQARRARRLFVRAGERENEGASLEAEGVVRVRVRDVDQGYAVARLGLERLRPFRGAYRLHNLLGWLATVLADDGFPRAALRVQNEGVRVAAHTGLDVYVVEASLARAQFLAGNGDEARVRREIDATRAALARVQAQNPRVGRWMVARRQMAEATASLRSSPARAAEALDSAAAFFRDTMGTNLVALPAIVAGAHAWLDAGDTARGFLRLDSAVQVLERRRDRIRMEPRRAAVFEDARALVDRAAMLRLAAGDTAGALRYLDRGRASLATVGEKPSRQAGRAAPARRGEVALEYAVVGDTLLAWAVGGDRVQMHRAAIDTARLSRSIERLLRRLEENAGEAELRGQLAQLYDWLVRPLGAALGPRGTPLVVIADGDLGAVPFAALYDARRRVYLVEDHPLRSTVSLREARRTARGRAPGTALFVADPAFDPREHPDFPRLAHAADEAREIAAEYPGAPLLRDTAATEGALRAALGGAGMVHYAGHAVFDDERPERSYLLLAPARGEPRAATLQAGEIAEMDLRHVSLVVLAACRTVRTGPGRAAGFSGLVGAFLAAGADGAVGSLWEVDDRLTRPLMVEFHRAYRATPNAPGALRTAQLRLLASGDPALRSPAAWAGFRYAGN
ncbi:MAG TPA: CHAT domain-containing protein [Longimicrobium sp.]